MFYIRIVKLSQKVMTERCRALKQVEMLSRKSSTSSDYFGRRLKGKVALTTASTDGIGLAAARRFAEEGAKVVISSRKKENVERAVKALKDEGHDVLGLACHVSKEEERTRLVNATIDTYGGIDIFFHNAGVNPIPIPIPEWDAGGILDCTEDAWDKIFEVNLKNTWQMTKLVVPHLRQRETGSITFIASAGAFNLTAAPQVIHTYGVSKLALAGLTKALAIQLAPYNIRVNSICPGPIKTDFIQMLMEDEAYREKIQAVTLLPRMGEAGDVSGVAAFLSSEDARFITGENIVVAGGAQTRI